MMNLQEALTVALDYEHKVRDHYAKGAKAIDNPQGKKVFETLAREEQGHVDYLTHCLTQWTKQGKVDPTDISPVVKPGLAWIEKAKEELKGKHETRVASATEIELLKVAFELEMTTSGFYRDLVGKLPEKDQPLFAKFLEIEEGHVAIVQAELDAVQGMGFWFDVMEFSLEAG
jgi:rubrerythrin